MSEADSQYPVSGAGLGLRRPLADKLRDVAPGEIDFMEVAPENWIHVGGAMGKKLRYFTERYPFLIHGLSLSKFVTFQDEATRLSQAEAALLRLFLEAPNRLLTRLHIQDRLGGGGRDGMDRAIDVRVSRLRGKLSDNPKDPMLIKTIYGAGYLFVGDVDWSAA